MAKKSEATHLPVGTWPMCQGAASGWRHRQRHSCMAKQRSNSRVGTAGHSNDTLLIVQKPAACLTKTCQIATQYGTIFMALHVFVLQCGFMLVCWTYPTWPMPSAVYALCVATREDEQAVSMVIEGPLRPNTKDRRPEATERVAPEHTEMGAQVAAYISRRTQAWQGIQLSTLREYAQASRICCTERSQHHTQPPASRPVAL